jgi:recA bacterial DNA recombination protein
MRYLTQLWDLLNLPLPATIVGTVLATALIAFAVWCWRRRRRQTPVVDAPPSPTRRRRQPPPPPPLTPERKQALAAALEQIERRHAEEKARRERALADAVEQIERQFGKGSVMRVGDAQKKTPEPPQTPREEPLSNGIEN